MLYADLQRLCDGRHLAFDFFWASTARIVAFSCRTECVGGRVIACVPLWLCLYTVFVCSYYSALLASGMSEASGGRALAPCDNDAAVLALLCYLYTGSHRYQHLHIHAF